MDIDEVYYRKQASMYLDKGFTLKEAKSELIRSTPGYRYNVIFLKFARAFDFVKTERSVLAKQKQEHERIKNSLWDSVFLPESLTTPK